MPPPLAPIRPLESFKDASSFYLPDLDAVLPDFIKPGFTDSVLDLESSEQMLIDLANILPYTDDSPPMSPIEDLDELVETHAQTLLSEEESSFQFQPTLQQMPPTPTSSVASSPGPSSVGCQSPAYASSVCSDSSNDPEWLLEQPPAKQAKGRARRKQSTRTPINRVERKKLQNKNAATRYRVKKKLEETELFQEEAELLERNKQLLAKLAEAETEMRIVKDLVRSKFRRMGLLD